MVVVGLMSYVGGTTGIDRDSPPAPGPTTTTSTYVPPPAWSTTTTTVHACSWDWKGGKFTVELWHDGSRVRRWVLPIALTPGVPTGGGGWDLQGSVDFTVDDCGEGFHYEVLVFATVEFKASVEPNVTPTSTSTWAPPNVQPPNRPPIVPISIMGSGMTYELYSFNGQGSGHVSFEWSASLSKILRTLPDGKYSVKVWCQVNYVSVDGAHSMTKYSDAVDLGSFVVSGGKVSYEG